MSYETEYLTEPFLQQYFLLEALIRDIDEDFDCRPLFDELAKLFCLLEAEGIAELYRVSQTDIFRAMTDLRDYERFCRTLAYAAESGQGLELIQHNRLHRAVINFSEAVIDLSAGHFELSRYQLIHVNPGQTQLLCHKLRHGPLA